MDQSKSKTEHMEQETWITSKWRPCVGWMYIAVCVSDFVIFPVLWTIVQSIDLQGSVITPWQPLTLQGGGLFHLSLGAILGVSAFGRTQEKLAITNKMPTEKFPPK